jgi:hypothetical protein
MKLPTKNQPDCAITAEKEAPPPQGRMLKRFFHRTASHPYGNIKQRCPEILTLCHSLGTSSRNA